MLASTKAMSTQECDPFTSSLALYFCGSLVKTHVRTNIDHNYMQSLGTLQLFISADAFANCAAAKPPLNTLFTVESVGSICFEDMQKYLGLIGALFELCPTGTWVLDFYSYS